MNPTSPSDPGAPAQVQVCRLALVYVAAMARARRHLGSDPDALHDLRVAVRRLRTMFRAYEAHVPSRAVDAKIRKRLKKLVRMTSTHRDEQVHQPWLDAWAARPSTGKSAVRGIGLLTERRSGGDGGEAARLQARISAYAGATARKLRSRLRKAIGNAGEPTGEAVTFGQAGSEAISELVGKLSKALADALAARETDAMHKARLHAKRLRYIVEPVHRKAPGGVSALRSLKRLQDQLGQLQDLATLRERTAAAVREAGEQWCETLIGERSRDRGDQAGGAASSAGGQLKSQSRARRRVEDLAAVHKLADQQVDKQMRLVVRTWSAGRVQRLCEQVERFGQRLAKAGKRRGRRKPVMGEGDAAADEGASRSSGGANGRPTNLS